MLHQVTGHGNEGCIMGDERHKKGNESDEQATEFTCIFVVSCPGVAADPVAVRLDLCAGVDALLPYPVCVFPAVSGVVLL